MRLRTLAIDTVATDARLRCRFISRRLSTTWSWSLLLCGKQNGTSYLSRCVTLAMNGMDNERVHGVEKRKREKEREWEWGGWESVNVSSISLHIITISDKYVIYTYITYVMSRIKDDSKCIETSKGSSSSSECLGKDWIVHCLRGFNICVYYVRRTYTIYILLHTKRLRYRTLGIDCIPMAMPWWIITIIIGGWMNVFGYFFSVRSVRWREHWDLTVSITNHCNKTSHFVPETVDSSHMGLTWCYGFLFSPFLPCTRVPFLCVGDPGKKWNHRGTTTQLYCFVQFCQWAPRLPRRISFSFSRLLRKGFRKNQRLSWFMFHIDFKKLFKNRIISSFR